MLVTCPLYLGLSVVAADFVAVVLGAKWQAMAPLMAILALAMPAQTLYILFAPAVNATGHVRVTARASLLGALIMPPAFMIGLHWGATGLAYAWLLAFPLLPLVIFLQARGTLRIGARELAGAVAPGLLASSAMALMVFALETKLTLLAPFGRLAIEVLWGAASYAVILLIFARANLRELIALVLPHGQGGPSTSAA
jgi:O-antigen/teichoic acid export membrane protein